MLEIADARAPWMQLEDAHLNEADKTRQVLDVEIGADGALLLDLDALEGLGRAGAGVLLIEAGLSLPLRAADQAERPLHDMRQDPIGDLFVESGQVALGDPLSRVEDAVRMRQRDAGDRRPVFRSSRAHLSAAVGAMGR